ncbi:MAG: hypothetical protein HOV83_40490 [Catenulispora sp.]|nr:hypothetical protein [Catenulispora sp.]
MPAPDALKWDSRLTVTVGSTVITPIDSFNPTFTTGVQPVHSLEADNVAHIVQPKTITFTMSVKAIGPVVAQLTHLARTSTKFALTLAEDHGSDWSFSKIAFSDCYITSVAGTVVIDGVPTTTFNCVCLDATTEPDKGF